MRPFADSASSRRNEVPTWPLCSANASTGPGEAHDTRRGGPSVFFARTPINARMPGASSILKPSTSAASSETFGGASLVYAKYSGRDGASSTWKRGRGTPSTVHARGVLLDAARVHEHMHVECIIALAGQRDHLRAERLGEHRAPRHGRERILGEADPAALRVERDAAHRRIVGVVLVGGGEAFCAQVLGHGGRDGVEIGAEMEALHGRMTRGSAGLFSPQRLREASRNGRRKSDYGRPATAITGRSRAGLPAARPPGAPS